jgi:hypothetical protein
MLNLATDDAIGTFAQFEVLVRQWRRVAAMPRPSSQRAGGGTGVSRRAKSSITIELAYIRRE